MKILKLNCEEYFSSNTYIYIKMGHALIVDLGFYNEEISSILKDLIIEGVILTHKHFDHIQGLKALQSEYTDAKIYTKVDKNDFFKDSNLNCSKSMCENGLISYDLQNICHLNEGKIKIGIFELDILYTSGHTSDSITIIDEAEKLIFTGDFIFSNSIGRMDLYTANQLDMYNSLKKIIPVLKKNNYTIYSGHDEKSFKSSEVLKYNEYLKRFN